MVIVFRGQALEDVFSIDFYSFIVCVFFCLVVSEPPFTSEHFRPARSQPLARSAPWRICKKDYKGRIPNTLEAGKLTYNIAIENGPFIVDLPIHSMVIFPSVM